LSPQLRFNFQEPDWEEVSELYDGAFESLPSISTVSSIHSSQSFWTRQPIPSFPDEAVIDEWTSIGEGGHGEVRRAKVHIGKKQDVFCIKLFPVDSREAFIRERDAYTLMTYQRLRRFIPQVYYQGQLPRWRWDGNQPDDYEMYNRNEIIFGLFMEFFEDCQQIDMRRVDLRIADVMARSFERILYSGVIHNDIEERNILLVREGGFLRVVWIDFSCAWSGEVNWRTAQIEWDTFCGFLLEHMVNPSTAPELKT